MEKKWYKKYIGFTLIELVIGITISMFLMVSVSVFVTSGMKNISLQKQVIENSKDDGVFLERLFSLLSNTSSGSLIQNFASGSLFKIEKELFEGGVLYVGEKKYTKLYCTTGSILQTTHLQYFPFVPYEGIGGDIFNHISQQNGNVTTSYFSGSVVYNGAPLTGEIYTPAGFVLGLGAWSNYIYVADGVGHQILRFDRTNPTTPGQKIIGRGTFGKDFKEGDFGDKIFLNNPTSVAIGESKLFISDTLNNRILYYDLVTRRTYTLLGEESGIKEPTGLYYDNAEKILYIANSGKGEVLKFQSKVIPSIPNMVFQISPGTNLVSIDNFSIDSFETLGPISGTLTYNNFNTGLNYSTGTIDRLDTYFTDFVTRESDSGTIGIPSCVNYIDYYLEGGKLKKETRNCISASTGSTVVDFGVINTNLIAANPYTISLNNVVGNFTSGKHYYTKLTLFNSDIQSYEKYYPFYTNGDGLIATKKDNILSVFVSGLSYPTGVYPSGANIVVNDFFTRKRRTYDSNGTFISEIALMPFDFKKIDQYAKNILSSPIKELRIQRNANLLNVFLKYYKTYSCESIEEENVEREFLFKKRVY